VPSLLLGSPMCWMIWWWYTAFMASLKSTVKAHCLQRLRKLCRHVKPWIVLVEGLRESTGWRAKMNKLNHRDFTGKMANMGHSAPSQLENGYLKNQKQSCQTRDALKSGSEDIRISPTGIQRYSELENLNVRKPLIDWATSSAKRVCKRF